MAKKKSLTTTCRKCGKPYHISSDVCPHCGLIDYWLRMARHYEQKAKECLETAEQMKAEKAREEQKAAGHE